MKRMIRMAALGFVLGILTGTQVARSSVSAVSPISAAENTAQPSDGVATVSSDSSRANTSHRDVSIPEQDQWCQPCPLPPIVSRETNVLALKKTEVHVQVLGPVAEVEVIQYYHNPAAFPVTVGYTFPLPGDAAVRALDIVIGDRRLRGELRPLEDARRLYDDARQAGHGAVLVEQQRANVFRARLANVLPGQDIAVRIRYVQTLTTNAGVVRYLYPTVVAPRYCPADLEDASIFDLPYVPSGIPGHAFEITVNIDAGARVARVASPSHPIAVATDGGATRVTLGRAVEIPNRDFILTWTIEATAPTAALWTGDRTDQGTPFLLVAYPARSAAAEERGREIIFILDSSGSMSGPKWDVASRALKGFLRGLSARDTIRLVEFDDNFTEFQNTARPFSQETLDRADAWIDGLRADGGTEILAPLEHVLKLSHDAERQRIIVLLTDGQVGNEQQVLDAVKRHADGARIFTLGIDYAVNDAMLKGVARLSHGSCLLLSPDEDVEGAILTLTQRFSSPVLTQLRLNAEGVTTFPTDLPDLFSSEPLIAIGRFTGAVPATLELTGQAERAAWQTRLTPERVTSGGVNLGALTTKAEIQAMLDAAADGDEDGVRQRVTALSLAGGVQSPYTAFVVVERRSEPTDTGSVRTVEVPVAFPQGWNWNTVFGGSGRRSSAGAFGRGLAMPGNMMLSTMSPMIASAPSSPKDGMMRSEAFDAAPQQTVDDATLMRRYLVRSQRVNGFWQVSGQDDVRTTAVALLALVKDYGAYTAAVDRATTALTGASLANADDLTRALVKAALEQAASVTGSTAAGTSATRIISTFVLPDAAALDQLSSQDDAASLATLVLAMTQSAAGNARAQAATRLIAQLDHSGADAGAIKQGAQGSVEFTALAAALSQ